MLGFYLSNFIFLLGCSASLCENVTYSNKIQIINNYIKANIAYEWA